jgi:hypothetical protein
VVSPVDGAGNIYVADSGNNIIRKITPEGVVTTLAGSPGASGTTDGAGSAARFTYPYGVVVDGSGTLFVTDAWAETIRKVTPGGVVTTTAGAAGVSGTADGIGNAARFQTPWGLSIDAFGNLFVADSDNDTIRRVTADGIVTTVVGVAGVGETVTGPLPGALNIPAGVATGPTGQLAITAQNTDAVLVTVGL